MKLLILFFLSLFWISCIDLDSPVIDLELINKINSDPSLGWKAGINENFIGKTYGDIIHYFGEPKIERGSYSNLKKQIDKDLPNHFDVYEQWPSCKLPIRNQGQCGDDFKFAEAEVLSDRICVAKNGSLKVLLSPQDLVSCSVGNTGCQGGYISKDLDYMKSTGVVTEECFPYVSAGGDVPPCPYKCKNSIPEENNEWTSSKHKITEYHKIASMEDAMKELMNQGSFFVIVNGYQDFFEYKSGVYYHRYGGVAGSHAMKVQGWGVDSTSGLPYWNCALAWTTQFGIDGYMWFLRGKGECGFEDYMWGYTPDL